MGRLPPDLLLTPRSSFRCSTPVGENLYDLCGLVMRSSAVIRQQGEVSPNEILPNKAIGLLIGLSDVDWQGDRWPIFLVCMPTGETRVGRVWFPEREDRVRVLL